MWSNQPSKGPVNLPEIWSHRMDAIKALRNYSTPPEAQLCSRNKCLIHVTNTLKIMLLKECHCCGYLKVNREYCSQGCRSTKDSPCCCKSTSSLTCFILAFRKIKHPLPCRWKLTNEENQTGLLWNKRNQTKVMERVPPGFRNGSIRGILPRECNP